MFVSTTMDILYFYLFITICFLIEYLFFNFLLVIFFYVLILKSLSSNPCTFSFRNYFVVDPIKQHLKLFIIIFDFFIHFDGIVGIVYNVYVINNISCAYYNVKYDIMILQLFTVFCNNIKYLHYIYNKHDCNIIPEDDSMRLHNIVIFLCIVKLFYLFI